MNYVIIKAGGTGIRVQPSDRPKQFIEILDKPIIIHTLEIFQKSPLVDGIVVVCLADWVDYMWDLLKKFGMDKVSEVVIGGENGHLSVKNGVMSLKNVAKKGDIVVVHDAVRPRFTHDILAETIEKAQETGSGIACSPCLESMFFSEDGSSLDVHQQPYKIYRAQAPQAYEFSGLMSAYETAEENGIEDCISTDHLYASLGLPLEAVKIGQQNFKVTTMEDVETLRALCYYDKFGKQQE